MKTVLKILFVFLVGSVLGKSADSDLTGPTSSKNKKP